MCTDGNCAGSSRWLGFIVIVSAIGLVVVAGIFFALAAALPAAVLAAGGGGLPAAGLLVAAVVLLVVVLLLLLFLLWCCCRGGAGGLGDPSRLRQLLGLFSALPALRQAIEDTAAALEAAGKALGLAHDVVHTAGTRIHDAGGDIDITVPTVQAKTTPMLGQNVVIGLEAGDPPLRPLGGVRTKLEEAGDAIRDPDGVAKHLGAAAAGCSGAAVGLRQVKHLLGG
ncbi:MAG TPA: hypothetical protein VGE02_08905 [Gemmatimonadales bacterium]